MEKRGLENLKESGTNNKITNIKVGIKSENAYLKSCAGNSKMVQPVKVLAMQILCSGFDPQNQGGENGPPSCAHACVLRVYVSNMCIFVCVCFVFCVSVSMSVSCACVVCLYVCVCLCVYA